MAIRTGKPGRRRRTARRAAFTGAAVSLALAVWPTGARAQEGDAPDLPDSFGGSASASALRGGLLTPALVPVEGLFDLAFAEGRGVYEASNQEGRASLVFPGNGLVLGPGLLCGTFLGPQIPPEGQPLFGPPVAACNGYQYPLTVFVDSLNPDGQTEGALALGAASDPVSLGAVGARAHAGLDATTTDAEVSDLRVNGAPAFGSLAPLLAAAGLPQPDSVLMGADGMTATTDQRVVDGRLVLDARATVTGLRLLGGLVRIGSIISTSHLETGGEEPPVSTADVEVSGVEVAGSPATLTDDGLVLGDPSAPSGPLLQQVTSAMGDVLQGAGLRIESLPVEQGEEDGIPFATAGGLLIELTTPLAGLPPLPGPTGDLDLNGTYGVRVQVGTTGVRGFADSFDDAASPRPVGQGGSGGGGGSVGGVGARVPTGGAAPVAPPPAGESPVADDIGGDDEPDGLLASVFAERLGLVYLSFTLSAVGLCLAPKLTLPARLPAAR